MLARTGFPVSDSDMIFKKKGRGRPRILNVQTKHQESADGKLEVLIHPTKMVAVGPGRKDFIKDLSLMVHQNIRHNVCKWKQVPQSVKDKIVKNALVRSGLLNSVSLAAPDYFVKMVVQTSESALIASV